MVASFGCGGASGPGTPAADQPTASTSYDDLVTLFEEWREFESPPLVDGVPDYSPQSMAGQRAELGLRVPVGVFLRRVLRLDLAAQRAHHPALRVEDLERDRLVRLFGQPVADQRAGGRVLARPGALKGRKAIQIENQLGRQG